jgi:hypothetical protein
MTAEIEARAAKVEADLEAKGIIWTMDLADMIREEIARSMMTGSATTRKIVAVVMDRIAA